MSKPVEPVLRPPPRTEIPSRSVAAAAKGREPSVKTQIGLDERAWQRMLLSIREPTRE